MKITTTTILALSFLLFACDGGETPGESHGHEHGPDTHTHAEEGDSDKGESNQEEFVVGDTAKTEEHGHTHADGEEHDHQH